MYNIIWQEISGIEHESREEIDYKLENVGNGASEFWSRRPQKL
jgi:hypothetical protein